MKISTREIRFNPNATAADKGTLSAWETKQITTGMAARFLTESTGIYPPLESDELIEIAHSFGYWQRGTLPEHIKKDIEAYSSFKKPSR